MTLGKPKNKKLIKPEDIYEMKTELESAGFDESEQERVITALTNTGFVKKHKIFGFREYTPPVVFFMQEDGQVKVIEKAQPGMLVVNEGKVELEQRYVLDPKKMVNIPNAIGIVTGKQQEEYIL